MKFILLLCMLTPVFPLNILQSNKTKLRVHSTNEMGKNIPACTQVKFEEVLIPEPVNNNHFIISPFAPDWEAVNM